MKYTPHPKDKPNAHIATVSRVIDRLKTLPSEAIVTLIHGDGAFVKIAVESSDGSFTDIVDNWGDIVEENKTYN